MLLEDFFLLLQMQKDGSLLGFFFCLAGFGWGFFGERGRLG